MPVYLIVLVAMAIARLVFRLAWWCVTHPLMAGFIALALLAASYGTAVLVVWLVFGAAAWGAFGVDRGPGAGVLSTLLLSICQALWWLICHPVVTAPAGVTLSALLVAGPIGPLALLAWLVSVGIVWRWLWPTSWERLATRAWRPAWRTLVHYWQPWPATMQAAKLTQRPEGDTTRLVPRRLRVRSTRWVDRVEAELLPGQHPGEWEDAAPKLAASFGADDCRVRRLDPRAHAVELAFRRGDPLTEVVKPLASVPVDRLDLSAVPLGITDWREPFSLPLADAHWLVAGAMRSGKGSVTGSLVNALAPAVHAGLVELYGCDPKGGIEMSMYAGLFTRLAWDPVDMIDLCEFTQAEMTARNASLRGQARSYTLSPETPHKVLIVDEFAALTVYLGNKRLRERFIETIGAILSQGGAPGYSVVGLVQDPRKDTIPMRDLFPIKIGLRIDGGPDITDAVLGDGSHAQGAYCDQIPLTARGVGYVRLDGQGLQRVRFTWTPDDYLRALAARYPAPQQVTDLHPIQSVEPAVAVEPVPKASVEWDDSDEDAAVWEVA